MFDIVEDMHVPIILTCGERRRHMMTSVLMLARLPHCAHDDTSSDAHGFSPLGVVATCVTMVYVLAAWLHVFDCWKL